MSKPVNENGHFYRIMARFVCTDQETSAALASIADAGDCRLGSSLDGIDVDYTRNYTIEYNQLPGESIPAIEERVVRYEGTPGGALQPGFLEEVLGRQAGLSPSRTVLEGVGTGLGGIIDLSFATPLTRRSNSDLQSPLALSFSLSTPSPFVNRRPDVNEQVPAGAAPSHHTLSPSPTGPPIVPLTTPNTDLRPMAAEAVLAPSGPLKGGLGAPARPAGPREGLQGTPGQEIQPITWYSAQGVPIYNFAIKTGPHYNSHVNLYAMLTPGDGISCQFFQQQMFTNDLFTFNPFLKSKTEPAMGFAQIQKIQKVWLAVENRKRSTRAEATMTNKVYMFGEMLNLMYGKGFLKNNTYAHREFLKAFRHGVTPASRSLFAPLESSLPRPFVSEGLVEDGGSRPGDDDSSACPSSGSAAPATLTSEDRAPKVGKSPIELKWDRTLEKIIDETVEEQNAAKAKEEDEINSLFAEVANHEEDGSDEEATESKGVEFYRRANQKLRQEKKMKQETLNKLVNVVDSLRTRLNSMSHIELKTKTSFIMKQVEVGLKKINKEHDEELKKDVASVYETINKFWSDFQRVKNKTSATESNIQKTLLLVSDRLVNLSTLVEQGFSRADDQSSSRSLQHPGARQHQHVQQQVIQHTGLLQPGLQIQRPRGQGVTFAGQGAPFAAQGSPFTGPPPTMPPMFGGASGWGQSQAPEQEQGLQRRKWGGQ